MNFISTRITLLISIIALAAGLIITLAFPQYDRTGSILLGFGVAALAITLGRMLTRKRPA